MTTMPNSEVHEPMGCAYAAAADLAPSLSMLQHLPRRTGTSEVLELRAELARLRRQVCGLKTALDMLAFGVVFVGVANEVLLTNAQADRQLRAGKGMRLSCGKLLLNKSADHQALQALLESAARPSRAARDHAGGCMQIAGACGHPLFITVAPSHRCDISEQVTAVIFISDPYERTQLPADLLRRCYGLTSAESRLVMLLIEGKSLREAAASQSTSPNTAKAHLKNVFAKTGVRRQTELMRLLLVCGGFTVSGN
jgi:DNA-binding CsgD family transcriptional regulator